MIDLCERAQLIGSWEMGAVRRMDGESWVRHVTVFVSITISRGVSYATVGMQPSSGGICIECVALHSPFACKRRDEEGSANYCSRTRFEMQLGTKTKMRFMQLFT